MDDVQVVEQAAEEALAERAHHILVVRADRAGNLFRLLQPRCLDQLGRDVAAPYDLARLEERRELGVVDDDADVAKVGGGAGKRLEHRLDRGVVALHRPDLDDIACAVACRDDRVGIGEGDAHRLLDEDVQARVERRKHDLGVRPGR